jgi:CHAT domain-containing protein
VKKLVLIVVVLCSHAIACRVKDTGKPEVWLRPVEPRLTGMSGWQPCRTTVRQGHVVEEAVCGAGYGQPERSVALPEACEEIVPSHAEALRILRSQPHCLDTAIAALEGFARTDTGARSDLSASYYLRAQQEDRPSDLLHALDEAERAVAATPRLSAARFNQALAREALGLTEEAVASWDQFREVDASRWAGEALQHRNRLATQLAFDAEAQWTLNRVRLEAALRARDPGSVARLIDPFPSAAERYLQEELLPRWAAAPSGAQLKSAKILATELSRRIEDHYVLDMVEAISRSSQSPEKVDALRQGHLAFSDARSAERAFDRKKAAALYGKAARLLERGGSPLSWLADLGFAVNVSFEPKGSTRSMAMLEPIERKAREGRHLHLLARIRSTRAYFLFYQGNYVDSLAEYDAALIEATRLQDIEGMATIHSRMSGIFRTMGHLELAWREAFQAIRHAHRIVEPRSRHVLLGETALTALALGHPATALVYQNNAVRLIQKELIAVPPERVDRIRHLQQNLAIALRERAGIELHLEQYDPARRDLEESTRLGKRRDNADANNQRALDARVEEMLGRAFLRTAPGGAVTSFTRALALTAGDEFRTFRAALLAQRAEAQRRAGRSPEAEKDLRAALGELQMEESSVLEHRRRGEGEELWSSYFSRFQETYQRLIRQLVDEHRADEAFAYAERSRAFEPLNLIGQLDVLPQAFRGLVPRGQTMGLAQIQRSLPRGTFLIEYCILDDRSYAWIVSRGQLVLLTLPVRRADVERWNAALQRAANQRNAGAFDRGLFAPYDAIVAGPLSAIRSMPDGRHPRLVFIPDGAMHGLPLAALRNPNTRRYLIEDATVSIAGSATLFVFSLLRDGALQSIRYPSVLLVGDPAFNEQLGFARGLKRLPGARREVERIQAFYAPRAELCVDRCATVPEFLERARNKTIVHVAGHAIANAQAPYRSLLLLAPSAQHSGALEAGELLTRLKLKETRLVVLSTCSSAGGLPVGPEGVAPLVRPLIAAGVPAVIGSLWDVQDATADELLVSFHRHYRQGSDAAVALQSAQLDLLRNKNPGLRSVLAWAPFQVIGHASSPFAPAPHE